VSAVWYGLQVAHGLAFKSSSKLSDCAFSLVDLPKEVSVADFL